jgi:hypothetical protein
MAEQKARLSMHESIRGLRAPALIAGLIAMAICALGATTAGGRDQFFNSYLFAYLFWLGVALGSMSLVFLHHLVGGAWGLAVRRPAEAAAMTLPLLLVMFVPLFFGVKYLYPWARPDLVAADRILEHQSAYLNLWGVVLRTVGFFAVWIILTFWIVQMGFKFDQTNDRLLARRMRKICAFGIVFYIASATLLGVDWIMAREAHWYSTVLGFMIVVGQALSALVFLIVILRILSRTEPMRDFVTPNILNDLGNLFLTLVILWAYMTFAQLLVTWMGNTTPETPWYVRRGLGREANAWKFVGLLLVALHFFCPFLLLLLRWTKRQFSRLVMLSLGMMLLRLIDVYWLAAPSSLRPMDFGMHISWMDILLPIGIGGIWLAAFCWLLEGLPLLPHMEAPDDEYDAEKSARETPYQRGDSRAFDAGH